MRRLLEREDELRVLAEVADDAAGGHGSLVLVGGEAGIGKTALTRALRERLADRVTFLVGGCEPLSVPIPLGPIRELVEAAGGEDLAELASDDRLVLARHVASVLEQRAPLVAVIEDAHWADPLTLDLVRLLARRVERLPVGVIVTFRDDEVAANQPLELLLGDLASAPAVHRIMLRPLSDSAVRELAGPAGIDAGALARVTGGNPFLVVEAVASGGALPASVRDAALARAGRLSAAARAAIDAAATLGQRFDVGLLEAVAPGSADAVEEALARGVLAADGERIGFRHELIREAIEASISPPRRAALHARVLRALEAQPGPGDHARLAHHAELAGLAGEACRHARAAADEAARLGAVREVALQSGRALRLGADLEPRERLELLVQCAHATNFSNPELEAAVAPAQEAIALATRIGDPVWHGRALIALAYALWSLDRSAESREATERAVAVLEPTDDLGTLARAHATRVRVEATAFDPQAAIALAPHALDLASRAGLEQTRIDIEISVGLARGHLGDLGALDALQAACRGARAAGDAIPTVRSYVNQVFVGALLRQHAFVDARAREAASLFDEYGTTIPGYAIQIFRARSVLDRGRLEEARATARSRRHWASETSVALAIDGLIGVRIGDPDGLSLIEQAWEALAGVPESSRHGYVRAALAEAAWIRGDPATMLRLHREALASSIGAHFVRPAGELALWAWRFGLRSPAPPNAPPPILLELRGEWRAAVAAWDKLEAPYEAALAALPGDERAGREAVAALHRLGATAAARAFTRERIARGASGARGPRRSTLAHPAGLTRREHEVLESIATGATNTAIAQVLHLSERTVSHHVSAILGKLGVANRLAAVEAARARGLLPAVTDAVQHGQPTAPT